MHEVKKIRVAVIYGGRSAEHEVSLQSAANIIQYLDPSRFEVIPIGIDRQGNWLLGNQVFSKSLAYQQVDKRHHDIDTWFTPEWLSKPVPALSSSSFTQLAAPELSFDVIFPAVHGTLCEDGTLQGLLELARVPYVGCGVLASAIGMDKDVAKRLASANNIATPPYLVIKQDQWEKNSHHWLEKITSTLSYPVFVKPANTGSSIGITKVKGAEQLTPAICHAFRFDTKILIEKGLYVRELEVAVLESIHNSQEPIVSTIGEIKPIAHEFYSYEAKYLDNHGTELIIPADLPPAISAAAHEMAKQLFITLECEGMARVDLFLDKETHQLYFNEINTIPGFTKISMYPKLMAASGVSYQELLSRLIDLAIQKFNYKNRLVRDCIA